MNEFINHCQNLLKLIHERQAITYEDSRDFRQLNQYYVKTMYNDLDQYEESMGHINQLKAMAGLEEARVLTAIDYDIRKLVSLSFIKDDRVQALIDKASYLLTTIEKDRLLETYRHYKFEVLPIEMDLKLSLSLKQPLFHRQLNIEKFTSDHLYNYGLAVSDNDIALSNFLNQYSEEKLDVMAETVVNAFLHGFISQNRNRRDRTCVKLAYHMGQEALVKRVVKEFSRYDIFPNPYMVQGYFKHQQYEYDHMYDIGLILDASYVAHYKKTVKEVYAKYEHQLCDVCGYVGLGSFGRVADAPISNSLHISLTEEQSKLYKDMTLYEKIIEDSYVKPSDISFCKVTFPNPSIKGNFEEIFNDFIMINTMESDAYERYQQIIIDQLDKGYAVCCQGRNGNLTDITIRMNQLASPNAQTNFMNCGGDLNIPHGEVFTTPVLTGTHGTLHFKEIFLKGYNYLDLILTIEDGRVVNYACSNFSHEEEGKAYVLKTLFKDNKNLPIGEFAIGTNTLAYAIVKKHGIVEELPILLVEKMGPHFAIGDPCYAFGEEQTIFNMLDNKEIVAKENEQTQLRHLDKSKAYVGIHTDMTIPYEDIGYLKILTEDEEHLLIENGLYVDETLSALNKPLISMERDYEPFLIAYREFLRKIYYQKNRLRKKDYFLQSREVLQKDNEALYSLYLEDYETSLINPDYVFKHYGEEGLMLSAILYEMKNMILLMYRNKEYLFNMYVVFIHQLCDYLENNKLHLIHSSYKRFKLNLLEEEDYGEYRSNFLSDVFYTALEDPNYLFRYGFYIRKEDYLTSRALSDMDVSLIQQSGSTIANAFHKGFKVSGKDKGERHIVKLQYHLGQEPLMHYVASHLKLLGYTTKVTDVFPSPLSEQAAMDHMEDQELVYDNEYLVYRKQLIKGHIENVSKVLQDICGFVRLLQFGKPPAETVQSDHKICLSDMTKSNIKELTTFERSLLNQYLNKGEMSYTGAAYPSANIGDDFEAIMKEIMIINNMDGDRYEVIQETIITALDGADHVHIKGKDGNETDIKVKLKTDFDKDRETIFKNTGADVNLPIGEVFTSPVLKGTYGLLHVSEVYRENFRFEELKLRFEDGMVTAYSCENYKNEMDNEKYILDALMYPHQSLPLGEFAIGTNTYAHKIAKKYNLLDKLPGLIIEKMGPHFAVGDTCFAYGEHVCVKNHLTGKEMVAKDNEITIKRLDNEPVYYHTHTDITIPYEELAFVRAVHKDKEIDIIRDGKFVLEGTEKLNEDLE